jgi:DNA replication and repair protein RecF
VRDCRGSRRRALHGAVAVELTTFMVRDFRNLAAQEFDFAPGTNVVLGPNGAGKTSLLEALVVLGNLRSFRTSSLRRAVCHGRGTFQLRGEVSEGGRTHDLEQLVDVGPPVSRTLRVNAVPVDVDRYLQNLPVFAMTAQDRDLVGGPPEGRRSFLDRFVFLLQPRFIDQARTYRRLLRQRNAALVGGSSNAEIEAWEQPLAAAAAGIVEARNMGAQILGRNFSHAWQSLSGKASPPVTVEYRSEPWLSPTNSLKTVEDLYRQRYNETRTRDRQVGFTVDGPHRHDLSIKAAGRSVRYVLSSGQTKGVAAALRIATLVQVERERNERFPVVVDDVDAELDSGALTLLVERLGSERQLFLSSTNERIAEFVGPRGRCIWIENGTRVSRETTRND